MGLQNNRVIDSIVIFDSEEEIGDEYRDTDINTFYYHIGVRLAQRDPTAAGGQ